MCYVEACMLVNIYGYFHAFIQIIYDIMVKMNHFNAKNPHFHYNSAFLVTNVPPNFVPPFII